MSEFKENFEAEDGTGFPGKTYVNELLKPVFKDQSEYLFDAMFMIHRAHTTMLKEQKMIKDDEAKKILNGVNKVSQMKKEELQYDPVYEDLFFLVESKIAELIGPDLAGKMHMAKSRNDMGEAMYRLVLREHLLELIDQTGALGQALIEQAKDHVNNVMPAHTHTQPAQPTTFAHYILAIADNLYRDVQRLWNAYDVVNRSPMGAAAITTTAFPINRHHVTELLGFKGVMENSYDAIATGDYLLESGLSIVSLMTNMGRWIQEFLRMASREVGLLKVSDAYVQASSIMPQKRNPVSLEHSRALASSAVGEGLTIVQMIHNTPYGDIVDTEDDLQPHLYEGFGKSLRVVKLMRAVIITMSFNKDKARSQAAMNMITITELADVLARDYGVPFREAHRLSSLVAKKSLSLNKELYELTPYEVNEWLEVVKISEEDWKAIVDPQQFVERRSIQGGPNSKVVKDMIEERTEVWRTMEKNVKSAWNHIEKIKLDLK
ncbi:argininosuccinate lyase [Halobacillus karajensis]|uniref:Argininosuccinate lyase n=1 Tax=Halobacillus karajensis TaxID=195088 RepID=A0A059NY39_9BACI|nr:argininosuccinate lyase [Halobacillus karajensis]CDQ19014.1 Argininosuccinate lyase [Halobacillus karajensis]CDQ22912.1 Argininosuccinate lyase [Halobacillus karajensis]CDQ26394.1 Argininosuccinate lyase [Halobacillus karajensis]